MITAYPGTTVSASLTLGTTGLVGTLAIQVVDAGQSNVAVARTTAGIVEFPAGSGVYGVPLVAPLAPGLYAVIWDVAGSHALTPQNSYYDQLTVIITDPQEYGGWSWDDNAGWVQDEDGLDDNPLFGDGDGVNISTGDPGSNPIPDAPYVAAASKLCFAELGYLPTDAGPGGLQELVDRAESQFFRITGQTLSQIDPSDAPLVRRVIQGLTEQQAMQGAEDQLETLADFDLLTSFNAGQYSEVRRDPGMMFKARMLNAVPWISDALWSFLTPQQYDFYISFFTGNNVPAWTSTDIFWEAGGALGSIGGPHPSNWFGA
jgi:hypothetical protein